MAQSTVQIPVETIEKIAALGKAMLSLAQDMQKHASNSSTTTPIPIPDLTRPEHVPAGEQGFWSEAWLQKEQKANDDIRAGRISQAFDTADALIASLTRSL